MLDRAKSSLIAAALVSTVLSSPAAEAEMTVKGNTRVRSEIQDRTDLSGYRAYHLLRFRPTFTFTAGADKERQFVFEPQFAQAFGALSGGTTITSGAFVDPTLGLHQAYALLPAGDFKFTLGRQILSYGDELLVGALDWKIVGRTFDAARVRFSADEKGGFTDLFASKIAETGEAAESEGDFDFYGFYNSANLGDAIQAFDLYVFYQLDGRGEGPRAIDLWTGGTRFKSDLGAADYRVEVTYQSGNFTGVRQTAYQADGEVGVDVGAGRAYVGGFTASENFRQLYPTAHKWLGTADILGRRNLVGPKAGVMMPLGGVKTALDVHHFSRADEDSPAFALNGSTALGSAAASSSKSIGTEADLTLTYNVDEQFVLSGGVSVMLPGAYLKDQFGSEKPVFGFAQLDFRF